MSPENASENRFLTAPLGRLFVSNAVPMMFIMVMNGLLTVVDAAFLGHFVGPDALAAVGLVFPALMITVALSTLVSGGMSSILARKLGAGAQGDAAAVFAQAHGLALCLSAVLIAAFGIGGGFVVDKLAGGQPEIAQMAYRYLGIMVLATPAQFLLGVHGDAWRNEGYAGLMAVLSVGVTLANIVLNYGLIVRLDMGVAGSALGTAMAQIAGVAVLVGLRLRGGGILSLAAVARARWTGGWRAIVGLGAPLSMAFVGIALVSATVIATLRLTAGPDYAGIVAAYGIVTRIFSFAFLPLMAISLATQSIVGNNFGAKLRQRSDAVLRIGLAVAFGYCLAVEMALLAGYAWIGVWFVTDPVIIAQVGDILYPMASLYLVSGPVLVLAMYFQAIGQPGRTAALTMVKPFVLSPLLIATFGVVWGVRAIWYAFPVADGVLLAGALGIWAAGRGGAAR